jgi:hypothetical protein
MRTPIAVIIAVPLLAILAGCSTGSPSPSSTPSATPSATAKATTLDPCKLVTAAEASQLSGASFGAGVEETTGSNGTGKRCTYGSQTKNVFFVQLGVATSADDAQAQWATEEAEADADLASEFPAELNVKFTKTDLTGLGDSAAVGTGSGTIEGQTISGGVIYLLKGQYFLAFGDLTLGTAPTADALEAQSATSLDRLP